jgi:hypothetical protein
MKRKVNRSKRAKIGSHGFKVHKNTKVYIGKATMSKSAVDEKLVSLVRNLWNSNESTKKMRKHIKYISIKNLSSAKRAGSWNLEKQKVEIVQVHYRPDLNWYEGTFIHEVEGHAFWDFSRKWRRQEIVKFNELANKMPPVNNYCKKYEKKWKEINDESWDSNAKEVHPSMTRYANEQHSAICEVVRNVGEKNILIGDKDLKKLVSAWHELHY